MNIEDLVRDNIRRLSPYSSARHECQATAQVFLDANENSCTLPLSWAENYRVNRYPPSDHMELREKIAEYVGVTSENIAIGNGSDEIIDLLYKIFCRPQQDSVIIMPPTFGMYQVMADIYNVEVHKIDLTRDFQVDLDLLWQTVDSHSKMIFLCSPNNPSGNLLHRRDIEEICQKFSGIVVVDEAYVDFAGADASALPLLEQHKNLIILRTFSKSWGLAGLRLGFAIACPEIVQFFLKTKSPYNVNGVSYQMALEAIKQRDWVISKVAEIRQERQRVMEAMLGLSTVEKVFPSDSNFLLLACQAQKIYDYLLQRGIVVRLKKNILSYGDTLRVTIGTRQENDIFIEAMKSYESLVCRS